MLSPLLLWDLSEQSDGCLIHEWILRVAREGRRRRYRH